MLVIEIGHGMASEINSDQNKGTHRPVSPLTTFGHFLDTTKKKGLTTNRKTLFSFTFLVGGAGFEPATPAV